MKNLTLKLNVEKFAALFNFGRKSTRLEFTKAISLPAEFCGPQHSVVKLFGAHIHGRNTENVFKRREAVLIKNLENGQTCIRYAMGGGNLSLDRFSFAIDYDGMVELGIRKEEKLNVVMKKAGTFDLMKMYYSHPEVGIRFSFRLSVVGVVLALLQMVQQHFGL